ncbi:MAG: mechanosensitive ion channel family protein [Lachnospiraceae bacterium]|nr:mechanosensitive ion channel family protein [Lachnospiraceae bacterium]
MTETVKEAAKDAVPDERVSVLKSFFKDLPEKALSLGIRIVLALAIFIVGRWIIKLIRGILKRSLRRARADEGVVQFVDSFLNALLTILFVFMIAINLGFDAAGMIAVLGSAGVAVSLAVQGTLSNFAGGVLILLLKPFKVGDYIKEDSHGNEGIVKEINFFYTKLLTLDKHVVVLPNGSLANTSLVNYTTTPLRRLDLSVGISYSADIKKAKKVAEKVLYEEPLVVIDEPVWTYVGALENSSVKLSMYCFVRSEDYFTARGILMEKLKLAFDRNGIEIPFNQLDVHIDR